MICNNNIITFTAYMARFLFFMVGHIAFYMGNYALDDGMYDYFWQLIRISSMNHTITMYSFLKIQVL